MDRRDKEKQVRDAVAALEENIAWTEIIRPWIERKAKAEREAHEDEAKTPHERAEHLHSMKLLRELMGLPCAVHERPLRHLAAPKGDQ